MPQLRVLRQSFVNRLIGSIRENLVRYKRADPWLPEFARGSQWELETYIEQSEEIALVDPVESDFRDLENAIRLHRLLPGLTPLQARDPRLWMHLTHLEVWSYMRRRWPIEKYLADPAKAERNIRDRYFVAKNESRALLRNGAARLWWSARLSYDPDRNNPYELTSVLFTYLDITQQILERNVGRASAVVRGFLGFLQNNSELLSGGEANRARIRALAKFLNLSGGVCVLDYLTGAEISGMLTREYDRLRDVERAAR
ncbi:MAG TPA: DUF6339 family protein [Thermoanaerobaculia bacterium]|nr:DUF6339 family protein [Thermoanaerobaculia bacterium]